MQVQRQIYTRQQALQKYYAHCRMTGEEAISIKDVIQDENFIRLIGYKGELAFAFTPEIIQTNHSFECIMSAF